MRRIHFERLRPVCPSCRIQGLDSYLLLRSDFVEIAGQITAGELFCTQAGCARTFPLIAGVPILVPDPDAWIAANTHLILTRQDLHWSAMQRIAVSAGSEAGINIVFQQQASYAFDHYRDLMELANETGGSEQSAESSIRCCFDAAHAHLSAFSGAALDIGCAVGRTSFDLAATSDEGLVLGIDVNWPLLSIARHVIDNGKIRYPHRLLGMHYNICDFPIAFHGEQRVDFWIADALALPFSGGSFSIITAFNVLDCVSSPTRMLEEVSRVSQTNGRVAISTPFDWASHATPQQAWLNGPAALDELISRLNKTASQERRNVMRPAVPSMDVPWNVRLHDRATMNYLTRLMMLSCDPI